MLDSLHPSILRHFARIDDPRQNAKVLYPLAEILLLALAATVAGADDFVEIWFEATPPRPSARFVISPPGSAKHHNYDPMNN